MDWNKFEDYFMRFIMVFAILVMVFTSIAMIKYIKEEFAGNNLERQETEMVMGAK